MPKMPTFKGQTLSLFQVTRRLLDFDVKPTIRAIVRLNLMHKFYGILYGQKFFRLGFWIPSKRPFSAHKTISLIGDPVKRRFLAIRTLGVYISYSTLFFKDFDMNHIWTNSSEFIFVDEALPPPFTMENRPCLRSPADPIRFWKIYSYNMNHICHHIIWIIYAKSMLFRKSHMFHMIWLNCLPSRDLSIQRHASSHPFAWVQF